MERKFIVTNEEGLHAQNATKLVYTANKYNSNSFIQLKEVAVNLKSIMGVLSLGINKGQEIKIIIDGHDEEEAMIEITNVIRELKLAREI